MQDTAAVDLAVDLAVTEAELRLPADGLPTQQLCFDIEKAMHQASWRGVEALKAALTPTLLQGIVVGATSILQQEPTLVELHPGEWPVTVVGDTHGQYHDVCHLFKTFGHPSTDRIYIFNGDFVDRGAWGVETLALLLAWKWLLPGNVYLIRGNHESNTVTRIYGFHAEMQAKYGGASQGLFTHIKRMFATLPLAALVNDTSLILHGGLFRAPPKVVPGKRKRISGKVDCLKDSWGVKGVVACDVLWSDPISGQGLHENEARGCGTVWGPDVTETFLSANNLKLIIRSHEGPDARSKRPPWDALPSVDTGFAVDHDTPSGQLVTLFSAPDYPQFMAEGEQRYRNKGAVLHLRPPDYATPSVESFEAVLPRPPAVSYYEVPSLSDEEEDDNVNGGETTRRQLLQLASVVATSAVLPAASQAAKAPRGFNPVQDLNDNYQFLYPFGWQEVTVTGADVVYKDVVEPLESVSVTITPTDKKDISEFGDIADVANTLATEVLTPPGQEVAIVSTNQRDTNGHTYYEFEYTAKTPRYTRHSLAVVVANDGKFYTLTTGANERRWGKMKDKLQTTIKSFSLVNA
eukprot:gene7123-7337_t